ncbi:MAG: AAA family ATPase [Anaerococcus sp.]|nr:AAA family ATPase [Peptoniphilaceae bacterium]MDY3055924.1 AAA family ATPase [Anaerococcus sp.]
MTKIYIKELDIISFGKFEDKKIKLDKNFNLIYGENESGKSTIKDFIEGVLYGFDQGKKRRSFSYKRDKYRPKLSYRYAGRILFSYNSSNIMVERNFDDGSYQIYDLDKNEEIEGPKSDLNFPGKYLLKLPYEAYQNLLVNYQSQNLSQDNKKILMEIFMDKPSDLNFSYNKARDILEKNLEDLGTARAFTKPYYLTKKKLEDLTKESKDLKNLRNSYEKDLLEVYKQRDLLNSYKKNLDDLRAKRDSYRSKLAYDNFREEEIKKKELKDIEKRLSSYKIYEQVNKSYFENLDKLIEEENKNDLKSEGKSNNFLFIVFIALVLLLAYMLKKPLILVSLILIYPLYINLNKDNKSSSENQINDQLARFSLKDIDSYINFKNSYYEYLNLRLEKEKLEEILSLLQRQERNKTVPENFVDIDITRLENDIGNLEKAYSRLSLDNIELEKRLSYVEEKLKNQLRVEEDLGFYKKKFNQIEDEIAANRLALDLLEKSKNEDVDLLDDLNEKINSIIRQISQGSYRSISYDEDLKPSLVKNDGSFIDLDQVSTGFFDQLNFALKLVLREKTSKNKYIIFDDAFINYDEKRLKNSLYFLLDLAENNQIIYLTCHKREEEIFNSEDIYVNKIILE